MNHFLKKLSNTVFLETSEKGKPQETMGRKTIGPVPLYLMDGSRLPQYTFSNGVVLFSLEKEAFF